MFFIFFQNISSSFLKKYFSKENLIQIFQQIFYLQRQGKARRRHTPRRAVPLDLASVIKYDRSCTTLTLVGTKGLALVGAKGLINTDIESLYQMDVS